MLKLNSQHALMATGLLPLLYMYFFSVPKYILGWGIGTYPLIVISFIAGMQYQRTTNIFVKVIAMVYPVVFSLLILQYGNAHFYYAYALLFGLALDTLLFVSRHVNSLYLVVRTFLVTAFSVLMFSLNGTPLHGMF